MAEKLKNDLEPWLPDEMIPDSECTLLQIWSRYRKEIQTTCGFNDATADDYRTALKQIADAPALQRPAPELDAYDVWEAVVSVLIIPTGKRAGEPYSPSALEKRLSVIHDIYMYLEGIAVCADPLWLPPWRLVRGGKLPDYNMLVGDIKDAVQDSCRRIREKSGGAAGLCALKASVEKRLVRMVMEHIGELDKPWFALALLIYLPIRLGEVCGLDLGDFHPFTAPWRSARCYIELGRAVAYDSVQEKDKMKNKNAVRGTVEPLELRSLRYLYLEALHRAGITDTDTLPVACGGAPGERYKPAHFSAFVKKQLEKAVSAKDLQLLALGAYAEDDVEESDSDAKAPLEARILRRNAFTKLTSETPLDADSQIRPIGGHETDDNYPFVFSEDSLWNILCRIDHRMILPELHEQTWVTRLNKERLEASVCETVRQEFVLSPELLQNGGTLVIDVDTASPGDSVLLEMMRMLPPGSSVKEEHYYMDAPCDPAGRAITDGAHWSVKKWT